VADRLSVIERCANEIAAVLCECCTVEEVENTLAVINPADWQRAAEKCLEAANHQGAVALTPEVAAVAATLVDLMKRNLPPHISEAQQVEAYLALKRVTRGR
jgi:hypothetical protein